MTEVTKGIVTSMVDGTKYQSWKWIGALIMVPKTTADGETHLAVSLTKVTKILIIGMIMTIFIAMLSMWVTRPEVMAEAAKVTDPIPDSMVNVFWGLLTLTGVGFGAGAVEAFKK